MLKIANKLFSSRLFTGTGKFSNNKVMMDAIIASGSELVTVALKRIDLDARQDSILGPLLANQQQHNLNLLPNTSGARTAEEAVYAAQLAREALHTDLIKIEIHPDPKYLLPDPVETLKASEILSAMGFVVLPYIHADPVLCKRLEEAGAAAVMPLGSPIGSNLGLKTREFIQIIVEQSSVPVVVDAGIGSPSDGALAMELGVDAVLVNSAIAVARDPVQMAIAFKEAIIAGRRSFKAGLGGRSLPAIASSPLTAFLDDL